MTYNSNIPGKLGISFDGLVRDIKLFNKNLFSQKAILSL